MFLDKIFSSASEEDKKVIGTIFDKISTIATEISDDELRKIAAFSGLLGRVAFSDLDISPEEIGKIDKILKRTSSLGENEINAVLQIVKEETARLVGLEDHIYTNEINELVSREQKFEMMVALFLVAAADKTITPVEEEELRKISKALHFSQNEFIEIRAKFKKYLSVFQG